MATEVIDTVFPSEPVEDFQPSFHAAKLCLELQPSLVEIRRHLRMHPEVGFKEFETSNYIAKVLKSRGFSPVRIATTGVYVDIHGDHPGPMVAYRADIDALPSQDEIIAPYASTVPGVGHLCGHDAHTSVGLGVALLLNRLRGYIHGSVRVFFQPNEEGMPSGAPELIKEGILDKVKAAYAIHVDPSIDSGKYGLIVGAATAAADRFDIIVDAKTTGHSARPHNTVDTVWVATQIANVLYQLSGRVTDPRHPSILTICKFDAGRAYNVIPATVTMGGTLRSTEHGARKQLKERLINAATEIGLLEGVEVHVQYHDGAPPVINNAVAISDIRSAIAEIYSANSVHDIVLPSMGAEDFAHYLMHVPGAMVRVGTRNGERTGYPLHDANFDIDEAALAPAAYLMSNVLMRSLNKMRTVNS